MIPAFETAVSNALSTQKSLSSRIQLLLSRGGRFFYLVGNLSFLFHIASLISVFECILNYNCFIGLQTEGL